MPGPNEDQQKETSLQKEVRFLAEDVKINSIMDMLGNIRFGSLTIRKFNGRIVSYTFDGEIKYILPPSEPKKGPGHT
jgi:hypothetical protein